VPPDIPPDSLQRALDQVFTRAAYDWLTRPTLGDWLRARWLALVDWLNALEQTNPTAFTTLLVALVVVLVALLVHIGYVLWRVLRRAPGPTTPVAAGARAPADIREHLARAAALAAEGRWIDALGHRFLALVLELDGRRAVRFHPSKTPAEYVGEARLDPAGRASLADVVSRLYRHVFGAAPCDAAAYEAFGTATQVVLHHVHSH
jgi:hypothetical protein